MFSLSITGAFTLRFFSNLVLFWLHLYVTYRCCTSKRRRCGSQFANQQRRFLVHMYILHVTLSFMACVLLVMYCTQRPDTRQSIVISSIMRQSQCHWRQVYPNRLVRNGPWPVGPLARWPIRCYSTKCTSTSTLCHCVHVGFYIVYSWMK